MHVTKVLSLVRLGREEDALAAAEAGVVASEGSGHPMGVVLYGIRAGLRAAVRKECDQAGEELGTLERIEESGPWGVQILAIVAVIHVDILRVSCPALYDGPVSLERIRAAYLLDPDDLNLRHGLGALLYREGEYAEAQEFLQRLDDERDFDDARDLFYLAMTYRRLGRRGEARRVYDRAVARLEATFPNEPLPRKLQEEAAALLGAGA